MSTMIAERPRAATRPVVAWAALLLAAVAAGVVFRTAQFLSRQSFHGDEVGLLVNIVGKSTGELMRAHLDNGQAAPPLFLEIQRALALGVGTGELTQRAVPFLLGLAALPLMAGLADRLLAPAGALLATALLCTCDKAIWYGAEVKQYSGDLAVTVALMVLFCRAIRNPSHQVWAVFAIAGAIAIWFSHAAILVFGGLAGAWLLRCLAIPHTERRRALSLWVALIASFVFSFLALYWISIRHQSADAFLQEWWSDSYVDWSHPLRVPLWLLGRLRSLASYPVSPFEWLGVVLVPLILLGLYDAARRGRGVLLSLALAPLAANLAAAALRRYPFSGSRVNLFLAPGLLLLAGAGLDALLQAIRGWSEDAKLTRWAGIAVSAVLMLPLLVRDTRCLVRPRNKGQFRAVIAYLKQHRAAGEPLYVMRDAAVFRWYWPDATPPVYLNQAPPVDPPPRYWATFTFSPEPRGPRDVHDRLDFLRGAGLETGHHLLIRGAAAYEFERKQSALDRVATSHP